MKVNELNSWVTLDILRVPARVQQKLAQKGASCALIEKMSLNPSTALCSLLGPKGQNWVQKRNLNASDVVHAQQRAQNVLSQLRSHQMWVVTPNSHPWLFNAVHPPLCLYGRGNSKLLGPELPKIAVVGTRHPTQQGKERTQKWVHHWVEKGFCIVSGAARGIDTTAHHSTFEAGGLTIAVLGNEWPAMIDPRRFTWPPEKYQSAFCALTEYAPWKPCHKGAFVARNRLVASMSDLSIMMEGKQNSGALHTLKYAKQLGKKTFAVPGAPESIMSTGASLAFATGLAEPALSAEFVALKYDGDRNKFKLPLDSAAQVAINAPLSPPRNAIGEPTQVAVYQLLSCLADKGACFDQILSELRINVSVLQIALSQLEMNGWIKQKGALYYAT